MRSRAGKGNRGFTLVELLIASVIVTALLGALGGLLTTSSRAYQTNERQTQNQQSLDAIVQFLRYDIRLAGYAGSGGDADLGGSPLKVKSNAFGPGDSVTVRYFEDRYGAPGVVSATYYVNDDGLVRDVGSGPEVLARGVTNLEVVDRSATALQLKIVRSGTEALFAVAFADPEQAAD